MVAELFEGLREPGARFSVELRDGQVLPVFWTVEMRFVQQRNFWPQIGVPSTVCKARSTARGRVHRV